MERWAWLLVAVVACGGSSGKSGAAGGEGAAGSAGAAGSQGAAGETGPAGPSGPQGPAGPQGPQGPAGAEGAAGKDAPAPTFTGGSRLVPRYSTYSYTGADGSSYSSVSGFWGWWDSQRQEGCFPQPASDGTTRCMPLTGGTGVPANYVQLTVSQTYTPH